MNDEYSISMLFVDKVCADLNKFELAEGNFPERENEIVVSKGILKVMGLEGKIGDTIHIPYQLSLIHI